MLDFLGFWSGNPRYFNAEMKARYSLEYGLVVFIGSIPIFVLFAVYRTILPFILYHLLNNVMATIVRYNAEGEVVYQMILFVICAFVFIDALINGYKHFKMSINDVKEAFKK